MKTSIHLVGQGFEAVMLCTAAVLAFCRIVNVVGVGVHEGRGYVGEATKIFFTRAV